jgi:hypothetical protein
VCRQSRNNAGLRHDRELRQCDDAELSRSSHCALPAATQPSILISGSPVTRWSIGQRPTFRLNDSSPFAPDDLSRIHRRYRAARLIALPSTLREEAVRREDRRYFAPMTAVSSVVSWPGMVGSESGLHKSCTQAGDDFGTATTCPTRQFWSGAVLESAPSGRRARMRDMNTCASGQHELTAMILGAGSRARDDGPMCNE